tara:strand:+ start:420 stop:569 length:150 start_codon:yes stop_codon:yes gene_type:complete
LLVKLDTKKRKKGTIKEISMMKKVINQMENAVPLAVSLMLLDDFLLLYP